MVLRWGANASAREARDRADAMLAILGLAKKAHLRPNQLSGGEKQRVAIGRALIKEPTFVFADEPTSALDWKHGEQVVDLLRAAAHDRGATILVVAHDARMIAHVDRVFHLEDGILAKGDAAAREEGVVCIGIADQEEGVRSLFPFQPGKVKEIFVKENDEVPEGWLLVSMDNRLAKEKMLEARADVKAAEEALA